MTICPFEDTVVVAMISSPRPATHGVLDPRFQGESFERHAHVPDLLPCEGLAVNDDQRQAGVAISVPFDAADESLVLRQLPSKLGPMDVARGDLAADLGVEPLKQLPGIRFEISEDREAVGLKRFVNDFEGFHLVACWHEHGAEPERVRSALRILQHDRLKLGLVEIDAEEVRRLPVEVGEAARPCPAT